MNRMFVRDTSAEERQIHARRVLQAERTGAAAAVHAVPVPPGECSLLQRPTAVVSDVKWSCWSCLC